MDLWPYLHHTRGHRWAGYVMAIAASLLALAIRWQLGDRLAGFPFITFFGAVFLVSFFGSRRAGFLTVALTAVLAKYYLIEPVGSFALESQSSVIAMAIYVAVTCAVVTIVGSLADAQRLKAQAVELLQKRPAYEEAEQFRVLVQGVRDFAIYMLDPKGHVSSWNSGAEQIKGYVADEILGKHFSLFYTPDDRASGEPARALATALEQGKYEREAQRVRKDGSLFWASVVIDPIFDEEGRHIGFAKITRDISERKHREFELEKARETAAQSQRLQALGEFTGGIAHDFNNLLTVIVGAADYLHKHPDAPSRKREQYLKSILTTSERATRLTGQLLAFARRQALRPEVIDLSAHMPAFGEMVQRLLGSKIEVIVSAPEAALNVEVDAAQFDSALLNAAVNARDAMPGGGRLTFTCVQVAEREGPVASLEIRDTGAGIPPDILSKVFDPFFTTKSVGEGTGLGLSQIHGFAAQAGGRAEIESEVGTGTVVRIVLPITSKAVDPKIAPDPSMPIPPGLRGLVVEDHDDVRRFAETLLGELGCSVTSVANGKQALDRLADDQFDFVFSDVVMPEMSGLELAAEMANRRLPIPILLASGYSDELIGEIPEQVSLIHKPYDLSALRDGLMAVLGLHQAK